MSLPDLGSFFVEIRAKTKVLQVNWFVFAFVSEVRHDLWRRNLDGRRTTSLAAALPTLTYRIQPQSAFGNVMEAFLPAAVGGSGA